MTSGRRALIVLALIAAALALLSLATRVPAATLCPGCAP